MLPCLAKGQISRGTQQRQTRSSDFIIIVNFPLQFLPQGSKQVWLELRTDLRLRPAFSAGWSHYHPHSLLLLLNSLHFPARGGGRWVSGLLAFAQVFPSPHSPQPFLPFHLSYGHFSNFLPSPSHSLNLCHTISLAQSVLNLFLVLPCSSVFLTSSVHLSLRHQDESSGFWKPYSVKKLEVEERHLWPNQYSFNNTGDGDSCEEGRKP
jgi:hypothetical protein